MNFLHSIIEHKREEVEARKRTLRTSALMDLEPFRRSPASLRAAIDAREDFAIIAEIKRASPSAGLLRSIIEPAGLAHEYEENGAAALSVLTDMRFFSADPEDLPSVRKAVNVPLLRKDFIIDEYQIVEAKAWGADAVLLIAAILDRRHLTDLFSAASGLGLECLVELYETAEIDILDFDTMKLIGVNNRDLRTFQVDLERTFRMKALLPGDITLVSESGIRTPEDLRRLRASGIRAALIGEHFMTAASPGRSLAALLRAIDHEAKS